MIRIAISACFFHADPLRPIFKGKTLQYVEQSLVHWAMSEGARAYMIPGAAEGGRVSLKEMVADFEALILHGGSDVSPKSYGEAPIKPEWSGDYIRDQYEIALLKEFMNQGKPVLGVCRGLQLMNVALGGTLIQDIATQIPNSLNHRNWDIYDQNFHQVEFVKGSGLSKTYGGAKGGKVNSVHHQALKDIAPGLEVEAKSVPDGVVEACRLKGNSYLLGVQWHPEFADPKDTSILNSKPLIHELMNAARK